MISLARNTRAGPEDVMPAKACPSAIQARAGIQGKTRNHEISTDSQEKRRVILENSGENGLGRFFVVLR